MSNLRNEACLRQIVDEIFNTWTGLRLAVEHGMGGRNGQKHAIDFMNYVYEYCLRNDNVVIQELQDLMEEIMDQEFSTMCEDNSTFEISTVIVKFLQLLKQEKYDEIEYEISKMPKNNHWLRPDVKVELKNQIDSSSSSSESDSVESDMEVDLTETSIDNQRKESKPNTTTDDGWTRVTYKK